MAPQFPRTTTQVGTWNVPTMYETGKTAQIAAEMRRYKLAVLGLCETRWTSSGQIRLATGDTLIYSRHEEEETPHTEGVIKSNAIKRSNWNPSGIEGIFIPHHFSKIPHQNTQGTDCTVLCPNKRIGCR